MKIKLDYLLLPDVHQRANQNSEHRFISHLKLRIYTEDPKSTAELIALLKRVQIPYGIDSKGQVILPKDAPITYSPLVKLSLSQLECLKKGSFTATEFEDFWLTFRLQNPITKEMLYEKTVSRMVDLITGFGGIDAYLFSLTPAARINPGLRFFDGAHELRDAAKGCFPPPPGPF